MTLNERVNELENIVKQLTAQIKDLSGNTQDKFKSPTSVVGGNDDRSKIQPIDNNSGLSQKLGGAVIWNTTDINATPNQEPVNPEVVIGAKGYNKHTHSRFSGGALLADALEIVQYDFILTPVSNKHNQSNWNPKPKIKKALNTNLESVDMIGVLDLVFDADKSKWGAAAHEIDVKKCYLVMRDDNGDIAIDSKGNQMKSPLYNDDNTKTSVVWDENAQVFRFYCVFAPGTGA